jgi:hypothetical protein
MSSQKEPLIIEHQGMAVKVLPYKPDGSPSGQVLIDFQSGSPIVMKGQEVK